MGKWVKHLADEGLQAHHETVALLAAAIPSRSEFCLGACVRQYEAVKRRGDIRKC